MRNRRAWKKKTVVLLGIVAAIIALLYLRWGAGFGDGDEQAKPQSLTGAASSVPPCEIRVDDTGVSVGDQPARLEEVAERCASKSARLLVTGAARYGDAEAVRKKLRQATIEILERKLPSAP